MASLLQNGEHQLGFLHAGYVAISKGDEDGKDRDVVIAFRGTVEESEWWSDFQPEMVR